MRQQSLFESREPEAPLASRLRPEMCIRDSLKDYIVEQNVAVGDKMPTEKEICEMYGVGRSTAREAYRMMQATYRAHFCK